MSYLTAGEPDDALEIRSLKVVPDPPVPGQKMTVYAEGIAKERIEVRTAQHQLILASVR